MIAALNRLVELVDARLDEDVDVAAAATCELWLPVEAG